MNKQCQGSKKKARKAAYEARKEKRAQKKRAREYFERVKNCGDIERMAACMGIKLK